MTNKKQTAITTQPLQTDMAVPGEGATVQLSAAHQFDPLQDTDQAKRAADVLVDIVRKNGWARRFGGQSEHLQYEAWQTVGKYYNLSVKTYDARYVEYGGVGGFEAKAEVINNQSGMTIGGAEAICMKDEPNWRGKPLFQLKSMAQTRAGSKALRQLLGFVVALAGYNPTPLEEMEGVTEHPLTPRQMGERAEQTATAVDVKCETCGAPASEKQGVTKAGKPYHAVFCSSGDKSHTKWINDATPKTPSQSPEDQLRTVEGRDADNVTDAVSPGVVKSVVGLHTEVSQAAADAPIIEASIPAVKISTDQKAEVITLLPKKGKSHNDLSKLLTGFFHVELLKDLTYKQADALLVKLRSLPDIEKTAEQLSL